MSRLTRDGTAEVVSRDQILRHARGQGNIHFHCSADHEQNSQHYPVDPYSAICDDHTYSTYIHKSLCSADRMPLKILEYIHFALKFGNISLPVEALVLPHLQSDAMLFEDSIMKAFGVKLGWAAERLSFKGSNVTIPATHTRRPIRLKYCSIITQDSATEDVPVFVSNK